MNIRTLQISILIATYFMCSAFIQKHPEFELSFAVSRVYQPLSLDYNQLEEATTISDLHPLYNPAWVKKFISVDIITTHAGEIRSTFALDDRLNTEQINNLKTVDNGSEVAVNVKYIPDNSLSHNSPQEFTFNFVVNPHQEAFFPGGERSLADYIKIHVQDKIASSHFKEHRIHAIQFSVDKSGQVIDAHIAEAAQHVYPEQSSAINDILINAICQMPRWMPATYADGNTTKQDFMLTAGDKYSCTYNLLNIRHLPVE